ncbi:hypothetical protein BDW59DRAFT_154030 [Aspergillus cavernicola]|uniref:Heterokaryon incompatibility domain-containing protein n=1 Tax=Aspergillus cavernicola TaxID=176166 RepID=A0ABR4HHY2_9EURO
MPVEAIPERSVPLCYICSWYLDIFYYNPRLTPGVYSDREMMTDKRFWRNRAWACYFRMILFHPRKPICCLSDISFYTQEDSGFYTLQVPWDENTGIVRSKDIDKSLLATALRQEVQGEAHSERLRGIPVHARCWQVLCKHKIWSLSGGNIRLVGAALRQRNARDWEHPLYPPRMQLHEDCWPVEGVEGDPFYSPRVQYTIRRACRRTQKLIQGDLPKPSSARDIIPDCKLATDQRRCSSPESDGILFG